MVASLPMRIARSLLFDLVIPWIISAVCIVVFFAMVAEFSLLAWPVCFLAFLAVCKMRETIRREEAEYLARERARQEASAQDPAV